MNAVKRLLAYKDNTPDWYEEVETLLKPVLKGLRVIIVDNNYAEFSGTSLMLGGLNRSKDAALDKFLAKHNLEFNTESTTGGRVSVVIQPTQGT